MNQKNYKVYKLNFSQFYFRSFMESVFKKFNEFKSQCQSEREMILVQDLRQQIRRLQQIKTLQSRLLLSSDLKQIDKLTKVYQLAVKEIERMKMQFTKPSLVKERLTQIFQSKKQQSNFEVVMEKSEEIRSSEIQIPTFKQSRNRQNFIDMPNTSGDFASPTLRNFFIKKQAELQNRGSRSNFKSVLEENESKSFTKSSNRSISREQPSQSRSNASSFKKQSKQSQIKKIIQENKKIKQEYEKRIKKELELSEFQKNLLREQKNRYMLKIEQLESELQNLYRANYKLKEEVQIKDKVLKQKTELGSSVSLNNPDENLQEDIGHSNDYYQPYVMKTKHNDLKRLNMKCKSQFDGSSVQNRSVNNFFLEPSLQINRSPEIKVSNPKNHTYQEPVIDLLGNELQKQLKEIEKQKSRSQNSRVSSKKWSRQYNPRRQHEDNGKGSKDQNIYKVFGQDDEEEQKLLVQISSGNNGLKKDNKSCILGDNASKNPFQKKDNSLILQQLKSPYEIQQRNAPQQVVPSSHQNRNSSFSKRTFQQQQSLRYNPVPNYSFNKTDNKDYSIGSNSNFDTFEMTRTYLNLSQNEQDSETNKYIDSRTSTRNKVAFFKDSLILIKNQSFELAFKRSSLVQTKDRVRVIFFVRNKTNQAITLNFRYEYDASYFKLKVNEKLETVPAFGQAREDLQVYSYSTIDLNEVIDIIVDVNFDKYGLWMPISWIQFEETDNFKMPEKSEQISVIPDRQFKNFQTAKFIIPLMFGGMDSTSQWAYLYGKTKFGPCYVKLVWEMNELKIQTNAKWIDLLAFIMHHVK